MTRPTTTSAADLQAQLKILHEERALALLTDLHEDVAYMADLADDLRATREAYVGAAVTELATLRARIDGPLRG